MTLSHWSFFSQSRLGFFLKISASFPALSILTILLDKCQTKSLEDMNVFIMAMIKILVTYKFQDVLAMNYSPFFGIKW